MTHPSSLRTFIWTFHAFVLQRFSAVIQFTAVRQLFVPRRDGFKLWSGRMIFLAAFLLCLHHPAQISAADRETKYPPLPFVSDYGGPFELTDHTGKRVSNKDFLGQYVILYFGYTDCADICPLALLSVATTLDELGPIGKEITPLFVNLDPKRFSLEDLEQYVHYFHPSFIGLTGTLEQIHAAASTYLVRYRNVTEPDGTRVVIHSGMIFFLGKDGRVVAYFPHDAPVEWMATGMKEHILADSDTTALNRNNSE